MADKGYDSREDILNCVMNGTIPQVIPKYGKEETVLTIEYMENDISEEERLSSNPEDIQKCLHAGVLPAIYEGSGISVEQQLPENISCFIKNEDELPVPRESYCTRRAQEAKIPYMQVRRPAVSVPRAARRGAHTKP